MSAAPGASSTNLFRRLTWQASIPLEIRLADNEPSGSAGGADRYYMYAPRYTYLPLLIPEIRENLVEMMLDDQQVAETKEAEWWFEEDLGENEGQGIEAGFAKQGACRWHWPLDLIHLHSMISHPLQSPATPKASSSAFDTTYAAGPSTKPAQPWTPLKLILHLSNPPKDQLLLPNTTEMCKSEFMNRMKEADLLRWRNTSRVTNMRRADLDAGWEGVVQDDYDMYMRMASRLIPPPVSLPPTAVPGAPSRPASTDPGGQRNQDSAYGVRGIPVRIYLPDGAPVIQDVLAPMTPEGEPGTLLASLHRLLPLLFPSPTSPPTRQGAPGNGPDPFALAQPIAQGIHLPPDAELAWLASCLCGADGWLRIGIQLRR